MLHIILLILKIIGIILLCILGVVLLALCCALFVPVRYRIEVFREEGEGKPPVVVRVKITWLLHLVNILIRYPADVYVRARVFLFTVFRIPEADHTKKGSEKNKKDRKKPKTKKEQKLSSKITSNEIEIPTEQAGSKDTLGSQTSEDTKIEDSVICVEESQNTGITDKPVSTEEAKEADEPSAEPQASGFLHKISRFIRKIRELAVKIRQIPDKIKTLLEKIRYTISRFCDKIKSASNTIKYYCEVLQSDAFARSWELCKEQIGMILKEVKPDKFEADLIIGTDDPASTGEILAVYGMIYPWIGQHVRIVGDFERPRIEGQLYLKGKIRAFVFLKIALKIYRNKDIKALIKLFKKEAV